MCLILLAYQVHQNYPLVLAANRDEFRARPSAAAAYWADAPRVLAGRDLKGGGTWLGVTKEGRLAALTNFREPRDFRPEAPTRGALVQRFLTSAVLPEAYGEELRREGARYNGFTLIYGTFHKLYCYCNVSAEVVALQPGLYGFSNHLPDTPWPKVVLGKEKLSRVLASEVVTPGSLLALLADRTEAPDARLPNTGIGISWERTLSPIFIDGADYGTRCSTVLLMDAEGNCTFEERSFPGGERTFVREKFRLPFD